MLLHRPLLYQSPLIYVKLFLSISPSLCLCLSIPVGVSAFLLASLAVSPSDAHSMLPPRPPNSRSRICRIRTTEVTFQFVDIEASIFFWGEMVSMNSTQTELSVRLPVKGLHTILVSEKQHTDNSTIQ